MFCEGTISIELNLYNNIALMKYLSIIQLECFNLIYHVVNYIKVKINEK